MTTLIYTPTPQGATKTPPVPRRHPSASFSRQAVFHAFGVRHGKALDQAAFADLSPGEFRRLAPGSWFQR